MTLSGEHQRDWQMMVAEARRLESVGMDTCQERAILAVDTELTSQGELKALLERIVALWKASHPDLSSGVSHGQDFYASFALRDAMAELAKWLEGQMTTCPECEGTGKWEDTSWEAPDPPEPCSRCGGTGRVDGSKRKE
jgi:rubrerythrin